MHVDDWSFYAGKPVLITGGCGFIGSNLALALVAAGARVTLLDSMIPDYGGNLHNIAPIAEHVRLNISDLRDPHATEYLVRDQEVIFNLAGQVSHIDSMRDPVTDLEINAKAQLKLLEACRRVNPGARIVLTGTRQIYGRPRYTPVDEDHPVEPVDVNGVNCVAGEWYHLLYHKVYGLPAVILRLTNTYGPRQLLKHNRQGFIGWFVRLVCLGEEIQIYGDGGQQRDLNYVDDVVRAILLAGQNERAVGRVYNLAGDTPISLKDLTEAMIRIAGRGRYTLVPWPEEKKRIDIGSIWCSYARIKDELGWQPRVGLEEGLEKTFNYYMKNLDKYLA
jgi:nucleoside-diphosphate-sugar epimerase